MLIDGRGRIVSVSEDRYLKVWEAKRCELIHAYFHNGKILWAFANSAVHSYCIVDEKNKLLLMDQDTLEVYHSLFVGKKIICASSGSYIYLHVDRYIMIYTWGLEL